MPYFILILLALFSCSKDKVSGGSAHEGEAQETQKIPNGSDSLKLLRGTLYKDQEPIGHEKLFLYNFQILPQGQTLSILDSTTSDSQGKFTLLLPPTITTWSLVSQNDSVGAFQIGSSIPSSLSLHQKPLLQYRFRTQSNFSQFFIPGWPHSPFSQDDKSFISAPVPQQSIQFVFLQGSLSYILPITPNGLEDTLYLLDLTPSTEKENSIPHLPSNFLKVKTVTYETIPQWYLEHDFTQIEYSEITSVRPQWLFQCNAYYDTSLFLGQSQKEIETLIQLHLNKASIILNRQELDANFQFKLNSLKKINGTSQSPVDKPTSAEYLIYFTKQNIKQSHFQNLVFDNTNFSFESENDLFPSSLAKTLAIKRGLFDATKTNVSKNIHSSDLYTSKVSLLTQPKTSKNLSAFSLWQLNQNANNILDKPPLEQLKIPDQIEIQFSTISPTNLYFYLAQSDSVQSTFVLNKQTTTGDNLLLSTSFLKKADASYYPNCFISSQGNYPAAWLPLDSLLLWKHNNPDKPYPLSLTLIP